MELWSMAVVSPCGPECCPSAMDTKYMAWIPLDAPISCDAYASPNLAWTFTYSVSTNI